MLNSFIQEFSDYCKTLHYAGKSLKELSRYIGAFNDFINKDQLTDITQVRYNHLLYPFYFFVNLLVPKQANSFPGNETSKIVSIS
jgi:hypothetical protein